jgi:hypothetical protein
MALDGVAGGASLSGGGTSGIVTIDFVGPAIIAGDVTGNTNAATVSKVNGVTLSGAAPQAGNVLTATSPTAAAWAAPATGGQVALSGDCTGPSNANVVAKINGVGVSGTPTSGQALIATGATAANWQPINITLGGDVTGPSGTSVVGKINGVAVSGTPSNGQVITATGAAAASWQNLPAPATTVTMGGDVTGLSNATVVGKLQGTIAISGTPANGQVLTATSASAANWQNPATGTGGTDTVATGLAATGTTLATSLALTNQLNEIITASAAANALSWGGTVTPGDRRKVRNASGVNVNFFPPSGGTINALAANTAMTIPTDSTAFFQALTATRFVTVP